MEEERRRGRRRTHLVGSLGGEFGPGEGIITGQRSRKLLAEN